MARRHLGSSHQEQRAMESYNEAEHAADRAKEAAAAGECVTALSTFRVAAVQMGRGQAYEKSGGTGEEVSARKQNARMALDDAHAAISACLRR